MKRKVHGLVALLIVVSPALMGQRVIPRSSFVLNFDYARFHNNEQSGYLELYYAFFPQLLTFELSNGRYNAAILLKTELRNVVSGEKAIDNNFVLPVSISDTADPAFQNTLITQTGFAVPFGEYVLKVTAYDSLDAVRIDTISQSVSIQSRPSGISMSDLELCSTIRQSDKRDDPFYKNAHEVVPNPTMVFGASNYPVVFTYLEAYNLIPQETYVVKTIVADAQGKIIRESSKKRKYGIKNIVEVGTTNVASLPSGKFKFQIYLLSESFQILSKTEKVFYAYNPQITAAPVTDIQAKEGEMSGLSAEELAAEFEMARYVATEQEIKTFSQITTQQGRREFLAKFWSEVERGKMGHAPTARREYIARVEKANERYRAFSRNGWRTDRGRVFVLYAEPDEIERRPSSEGAKPYEIWYYYQVENGVEFVFVDRTGFGEYVLVHSTKRGELRDDQWERLLQ